ncbi:FAD-dependent oxidoreductase [Luteimicrobium sp. DT211]|uniref:FAD-dependent oxidoreductase n=1 Tax=Luteimicrobium sp. DT211 TaxID=3393412 RepID=UPI003CE78180
MSTPTLSAARISIIGAGPGGLTAARILQQRGIDVTVYDRDSGPRARNQGGSLDLHDDDGQVALREAGLIDQFFALARFEGQEMRILKPDGGIISHHVPEAGEAISPEIDRGQLRGLLLDSLIPGTIRWGHELVSVSGNDAGPRTLTFDDGRTEEADLVIGADGARSRVRAAVSAARPAYAGGTFLEAWFDEMDTEHPELVELVGGGSATASDGDRALFAQRNSGGRMRVYVIQRATADWIAEAGLQPDDTTGIRAHLTTQFASWSPALVRLITDNVGPYVDRPLFALPVPLTWQHSPNIALLGDAAHLMPPLGVGVNLAMLDAAELAVAIASASSLDEAVTAYESTMIPRSSEIAQMLDGGVEMLFDGRAWELGADDGPGDRDDEARPPRTTTSPEARPTRS